jgi:hypothetical protein
MERRDPGARTTTPKANLQTRHGPRVFRAHTLCLCRAHRSEGHDAHGRA